MAPVSFVPGATDADVAAWMEQRLDAGAPIAISVPGGSTPVPIIAELARGATRWDLIEIWPGDDRIVPEDHPASNTGTIRRALEPRGAAIAPLSEAAAPPHFRLVWLGMGADGHIASLFPNTDPRADDPLRVRRLVPDPLPPEAPFPRLSLTIPALLDSDELVFVIRGADKLALFRQAAAGAIDLPVARLLKAATQPVTCFC